MPSPLPVATKITFYAVKLAWGDPEQEERYVLKAGAEPLFGETFSELPGGDLELGSYTVALEDRRISLILPLVTGLFSDKCSSGDPFPPAKITVWEITTSPITSDRVIHTLVEGKLSVATRNARGREGLVRISVSSEKDFLGVPFGLPVNAQCSWALGSALCSATVATHLATVASVNNKEVVLSPVSPSVPGSVETETYFFRGSVSREGVTIPIRGWAKDTPDTYLLSKSAPVSWIGQQVTVTPGCDKTIDVCRDRWLNEEHFMGLGIKMPAYKPNFETPS